MVIPATGGAAVPIQGGIDGRLPAWSPSSGRLAFSASNHVHVATFSATPTPTLSSVRRVDGGLPSGTAEAPTWAPADNALAFTFRNTSSEFIVLANLDGRANTRITFGTQHCFTPHWGPAATTLPAPTVTSVSPSSGPVGGGTAVTITGTGFHPGTTVRLDGLLATAVGGSPTTLDVTTPAHAAGPVAVAVSNPDGQTAILAAGYTYAAPSAAPTIASVTPNSGPTAGGTAVTVNGTGFGPGTSVTIGGLLATAVGGSPTTLDVTTPAHAPGAVSVVVTNPDGQTVTLTDGFTYTAPAAAPTITTVSPNSGPTAGGTSVTVNGTGFSLGTTVTFDGIPAIAVGGSPTTLDVTSPAHVAGPVTVVVTNPDGQSASLVAGFTYADAAPAPTIASIDPATGPTIGGTNVTITGSGFSLGTTVAFDGLLATALGGSPTSLSVTTPAHAAGPVTVVVTNPDGQSATLVTGFHLHVAGGGGSDHQVGETRAGPREGRDEGDHRRYGIRERLDG